MALRLLSTLLLAMFAGACGGEEPAATAPPEVEPLSVTQWTGRSELFAEYPALVLGQTSRFAIHLTDISNFKPVTSGQVEVRLEGGGATPETFRVDAPSRPGIFGVDVKPARAAGAREIVIALKSVSDYRYASVFQGHGVSRSRGSAKGRRRGTGGGRGHQLLKGTAVGAGFRHRVAEERAIRDIDLACRRKSSRARGAPRTSSLLWMDA